MALSKNTRDLFFLMKVWKENGIKIDDNLKVTSSDDFLTSETGYTMEEVYESEDGEYILFDDLEKIRMNEDGYIILDNHSAYVREGSPYFGKKFEKKKMLVLNARFFADKNNHKIKNYFSNMKEVSENISYNTKFYNSENSSKKFDRRNGFALDNHKLQGYKLRIPIDSNNLDHQVFINAYSNLLHSNKMEFKTENYESYRKGINPKYLKNMDFDHEFSGEDKAKRIENMNSSILFDDEKYILSCLYKKKAAVFLNNGDEDPIKLKNNEDHEEHLKDLKERNLLLFNEIAEFRMEYISKKDEFDSYEDFLRQKSMKLESPDFIIEDIKEEDILRRDLEIATTNLKKKIRKKSKPDAIQQNIFHENPIPVDPDALAAKEAAKEAKRAKKIEKEIMTRIGQRADEHAAKKVEEEEKAKYSEFTPQGGWDSAVDNMTGRDLVQLTGNADYAIPSYNESEEDKLRKDNQNRRFRIAKDKKTRTIA